MKIIPQERYYKEGLELIKFAEIESGTFQNSYQDKFADNFNKGKDFGDSRPKVGDLVLLYDGGLGPEDEGCLSMCQIKNQTDLEKISYLDSHYLIRIFGTRAFLEKNNSFEYIPLKYFDGLLINSKDYDLNPILTLFNSLNIFLIDSKKWLVHNAEDFNRGSIIRKNFYFPFSAMRKTLSSLGQDIEIDENKMFEEFILAWKKDALPESDYASYEMMLSTIKKELKSNLSEVISLMHLREKYLGLIPFKSLGNFSPLLEHFFQGYSLETNLDVLLKFHEKDISEFEEFSMVCKDYLKATAFFDLKLLRLFFHDPE